MADNFSLILEDFEEELEALRYLVTSFQGPSVPARSRVAAANSATLLLAATFEEFIRQAAREFARQKVASCSSVDALPAKLIPTAWRRTLDNMSKIKLDARNLAEDVSFVAAQNRFSNLYEFCRGDLSKDIFQDLIHNESNMRSSELNSLFKVSGISDICLRVAHIQQMMEHFDQSEAGKAHGKILNALNEFFERRNSIAHALNAGQSSGPTQILYEISLLRALSQSITQCIRDSI